MTLVQGKKIELATGSVVETFFNFRRMLMYAGYNEYKGYSLRL
jgi:hypothetical protein